MFNTIALNNGAARVGLRPVLLSVLLSALIVASLFSIAVGSYEIPIGDVVRVLLAQAGLADITGTEAARQELVVMSLRLPRTLMAILVGAGLAIAGAVLQGIFRNPLADPTLVGVSSGAAFAAALTIVLSTGSLGWLFSYFGYFTLPIFAFFGGLATTMVLYKMATRHGKTSVSTMLLAGIAIGALANAGTGILIFYSNDDQLRDLTFWMMGSVGGATWSTVLPLFLLLPVFLLLLSAANPLNKLLLGGREARLMGVDVDRLVRWLIVGVALTVGAAVSVSGVIGFVGIVVSPYHTPDCWSRSSSCFAGIASARRATDGIGGYAGQNLGGTGGTAHWDPDRHHGGSLLHLAFARHAPHFGRLIMLRADNVSLKIGSNQILNEVSLMVKPGEFLCLLGPNGAGKSSLVQLMTGERMPSQGQASLDGRLISDFKPMELARRRGVLSQHTELSFAFTAAEVVSLGLADGIREPELEYWALDQVGLADRGHQSYPTFSGGEQQRIHLARVLLQLRSGQVKGETQYLILDEPTASLDLAFQHHVLGLARKLAETGLGVMAVLHDINQAIRYADRVTILKQGQIAVNGNPKEVISADRVGDIYGLEVHILNHPESGLPYILPA